MGWANHYSSCFYIPRKKTTRQKSEKKKQKQRKHPHYIILI